MLPTPHIITHTLVKIQKYPFCIDWILSFKHNLIVQTQCHNHTKGSKGYVWITKYRCILRILKYEHLHLSNTTNLLLLSLTFQIKKRFFIKNVKALTNLDPTFFQPFLSICFFVHSDQATSSTCTYLYSRQATSSLIFGKFFINSCLFCFWYM